MTIVKERNSGAPRVRGGGLVVVRTSDTEYNTSPKTVGDLSCKQCVVVEWGEGKGRQHSFFSPLSPPFFRDSVRVSCARRRRRHHIPAQSNKAGAQHLKREEAIGFHRLLFYYKSSLLAAAGPKGGTGRIYIYTYYLLYRRMHAWNRCQFVNLDITTSVPQKARMEREVEMPKLLRSAIILSPIWAES